MRSIKVLPDSVRNSLRSGIILSDLTRVVEELVFNSLDAGATKVIVAVGVGTNYIKVTDNGCGITRDGLVLLGERYATSKFEQLSGLNTVPESFGFRGEALSSISDLSLLQVVTKAHGMPNGYCKVIKCSKCLYLGIDDDRQDVGTTVVVRDLFYNQPVRRRHLQSSPKKVLHSVKECILRIALVHLGTCFKVIDTESGDELLSLYPSSSPLPLLVSSFGTEVSSSLHKLDESDDKLKLSGFISSPCETFSVKAFQYFYINSRYISRGPIHKLLNQLATDSELLKGDIRSECGKRSRCHACLTYILNLTCPRAHYDLSFEPTKTCAEFKEWDPVLTFIKKAVSCFWSQDPLNDCGVPKKRCVTWSHETSIVLSSPQLQMSTESKQWNPNNKLLLKESPPIQFHFDNHLIKPFLRSCSSHLDLSPVTKIQDDEFDNIIQGSESWLDKSTTVWSPPRIISTSNLGVDSPFLPKESFDSLLTNGDLFTENNNSPWDTPVASKHQSDWSPLMFDESRDDVDFKLGKDDWFDLFADDEGEKDIFDFDNMRYSSSQEGFMSFKGHVRNSRKDTRLCDFMNGIDWAGPESYMSSLSCGERVKKTKVTQSSFQDKKQPRRRSHSAPPSYRGKRKFIALNSQMSVKSGNSQFETLHNASLQEASDLRHVQKSSGADHLLLKEGEGPTKARHDKKKVIDKAEISDYEGEADHCLDVFNTDSDFTSRDNEGALDFGEKWRSGYPSDSSIEKKGDEDKILDISSGILHLSGDSLTLTPKSISKKCLDDSKVLQQVDKKFIPIVGGGILAIIDQHAADERIRLEDLRKKVLSGKMKTICYLDAEQELVLPEIGYQLLINYSEQIKKWGWICNFHAQSSVSFKKNLNFLHNQPSVATLIAVPCILGVNLTDADLLEFLKQLADTDGSSILPPAVVRVLNTKACRGAIMFGDALLPSECSLIVEELKKTSLCFQCAHGRPTTVALVDMVVLHKQIDKLGNCKGGGSWHGLSRHRPSLERASQRLGQ
ncbi:unnamed protein product [Lactuca saligna]|uniref:DNA mismatch repair protein MLH3 n=1 Tax=Lactuca saligna TaxID=75948 RepID=A0AA35VXS5_LACSI|nr:unnamed protein product [Lactuca saligna]